MFGFKLPPAQAPARRRSGATPPRFPRRFRGTDDHPPGTVIRRRHDAIYGYLEAVFAIVMHYKVRRRTTRLIRHAFKCADRSFDKNADSFTAVIRCTSERDIDAKTVSKYARALRYAARRKQPRMRLKKFMKKAGGVNACANLYAKHFGRGQSR
jgi:hypothetical protein